MKDFRNERIIRVREQMTKFDINVANNIDKQLSYQNVISIIFLLFSEEKIKVARQLCKEVEETATVWQNHYSPSRQNQPIWQNQERRTKNA